MSLVDHLVQPLDCCCPFYPKSFRLLSPFKPIKITDVCRFAFIITPFFFSYVVVYFGLIIIAEFKFTFV